MPCNFLMFYRAGVNCNEVLARQRCGNSSNYLVKEGASITEIDAKFQDQIVKGYIVKINLTREDINQKFFSDQSLHSNFRISVTFEMIS